ncbi:MAG TPA: Sec-independent protein translocase protein TatB [Burkholderiales bacterium]|nr:Sec-independent protein translocase protein TatB [Burkholderiales bacterium]
MLDIGFSELMVIGVVALVVLGPERLPRVARTTGHLLGRFQRYVAEVKADINREIELSELKKIQANVEDAARSIETTVKSEIQQAEQELRSVESEFNQAGEQIKKAHSEITQSVSALSAMPHMGMGHAGAEPIQYEAHPVQSDANAATGEHGLTTADEAPSPQLELGFSTPTGPASSFASAPSKPS